MKKLTIFASIFTFAFYGQVLANCLDPSSSEMIFSEIFKDKSTLAVYCSKTNENVETCFVLNSPKIVSTFKKVSINKDGNKIFSICDFNVIELDNSDLLYKKDLSKENPGTES